MKGLVPLILGIFGTFVFSWTGLIAIPNAQIGHLDPQMDEDGNDPYPAPKSGMADRGRRIYVGNGCTYCHSQQMRADYAGSDLERTRDADPNKPKWGERRSAPRDYLFERPALLGKMRMGPDLANIGKAAPAEEGNATSAASPAAVTPQASPAANATSAASPAAPPVAATPTAAGAPAVAAQPPGSAASPAPATATVVPGKEGEPLLYSAAWHHRHLYQPRSVAHDSTMPAYPFLYEKRRITGEKSADALMLTGKNAPEEGWEIVPSYDAKCLVAYLMSLDQSHALTEVKSAAAPASGAAAPGKAVK